MTTDQASRQPHLFIVCGPTGAGKTTYARQLARRHAALRFSIDPWMQTLFGPDQGALNFEWMLERTARCERQIWELAEQALALGTSIVLDLGFTTHAHRRANVERARRLRATPSVHYIDTPVDIRRRRVADRNARKDPAVYAFEVTDMMFDFMEPRFEVPDAEELEGGRHVRETENSVDPG